MQYHLIEVPWVYTSFVEIRIFCEVYEWKCNQVNHNKSQEPVKIHYISCIHPLYIFFYYIDWKMLLGFLFYRTPPDLDPDSSWPGFHGTRNPSDRDSSLPGIPPIMGFLPKPYYCWDKILSKWNFLKKNLGFRGNPIKKESPFIEECQDERSSVGGMPG